MKISPGKAASITSLLLLLFFPNFLVLLGYTVNESIFLGIVAGISGGLIAGWSHMEPEAKQAEEEEEKVEEGDQSLSEITSIPNNKSISEEKNQNQNLSDADSEEYSSAIETRGKDNINNSESYSLVPRNYELKFIESVLPKEGEKAENKSSQENNANSNKLARRNEGSTRAGRKGVSLFSWFLMNKKGESSKNRRR